MSKSLIMSQSFISIWELGLSLENAVDSILTAARKGPYVANNEESGELVTNIAALNCMALPVEAKQSGDVLFKVGADFGEALAKVYLNVKHKDLYFPRNHFAIEFPDNWQRKDAAVKYKGVMISAAPAEKDGHRPSMFVFFKSDGFVDSPVTLVSGPPDGTADIEQHLNALEYSPGTMGGGLLDDSIQSAYRFTCNVLTYLKSGDPDLREIKPKKLSYMQKRKMTEEEKAAYDGLRRTLVGFNYKKAPLYSMDETSVRGHFRWQPWGPGRDKVKLIWIDAHVRTYDNVLP